MIVSRRALIGAGGMIATGLAAWRAAAGSEPPIDIVMRGNADGSRVGFDPVGLHIAPGRTVRWINRDPGNAHTATAYHPRILDRPLRMPGPAEPWDSDYLLPAGSFSVTLTVPGVYDYYCIPHEHAGMVGRLVVGAPQDAGGTLEPASAEATPLPTAALRGFPPVAEIIRQGAVPGMRAIRTQEKRGG